ncbi:MAG: hypothetical protein ABR863_10480 [Roseiarcus sp.]
MDWIFRANCGLVNCHGKHSHAGGGHNCRQSIFYHLFTLRPTADGGPHPIASVVHHIAMKLDLGLIAKLKLCDAIVGCCNLVINSAFENGDSPEHKMLFGGIPDVPGVVDI